MKEIQWDDLKDQIGKQIVFQKGDDKAQYLLEEFRQDSLVVKKGEQKIFIVPTDFHNHELNYKIFVYD